MAQKNILTNFTVVAGVEGQNTLQSLAKQLDGLSFSAKKLGNDLRSVSGGSGIQQIQRDADGAKNSVRSLADTFEEYKFKVIGAAAAATGFVGILKGILKVQSDIDQLNAGLNIVNQGDLGQTADDIEFLRKETDRLGLAFVETSALFTKVNAAAQTSGLTAETTREIFSSFAGTVGRLNLSADSSNRIFFALQQILSKNVVSSEELKNQLGEKLPGILAISARAIGTNTTQLQKMLENGEVIATDFLPKLAKELQATFNVDSNTRIESAAAATNRFKNAVTDLQQEIVGGGLGNALASLTEVAAKNLDLIVGATVIVGFSKLTASMLAARGALQAKAIQAAIDASETAKNAFAAQKAAQASAELAAAKVREAQAMIAATGATRANQAILNNAAAASAASIIELGNANAEAAKQKELLAKRAGGAFAAVRFGAGRLLSFLGGPWVFGLTTAATLAYQAYETFGRESSSSLDDVGKASDTNKDVVTSNSNAVIAQLQREIDQYNKLRAVASKAPTALEAAARSQSTIGEEIKLLQTTGLFRGQLFDQNKEQAAIQSILQTLGAEYGKVSAKVDEFKSKQAEAFGEEAKKLTSGYLSKFGDDTEKLSTALAEATEKYAKLNMPVPPEVEAAIRSRFTKPIKEAGGAVRGLAKEQSKASDALQTVIDNEILRGEVLRIQIELGRELTETEKQYFEDVKKFGKVDADRVKAIREQNDALKNLIELRQEEAKFTRDLETSARRESESLGERTKQLEDEIARIGLKTEALAELETQALLTAAALARESAEDVGGFNPTLYAERIRQAEELEKQAGLIKRKAAKEAAQDRLEEEQRANKQIVDDFVSLFKDVSVESGEQFAKDIKRALEVQFRSYVLRVVAEATLGVNSKGEATGGGLLNKINGSSVGGGLSDILGSAGSFANLGAASNTMANAAVFASAKLAEFAGLSTAATGSLTSFAASAGAAVPYIGAAITAYQIISSLRGKKISATGLDPETLKPITEATQQGFNTLLTALGGTGSAQFSATGNTGRQGQNANFNLNATANGRQIFNSNQTAEGQADGLFIGGEIALNEAGIADQTTRAIVAALKLSDFADNIDAVLAGLDPLNGELDALNAGLQNAQLLAGVNNLTEMGGALASLSGASLETVQSLIALTGGIEALAQGQQAFYDAFTNDTQKTADLTKMVTEAFAQFGKEVPTTREGLVALRDGLDLQDETQQKLLATIYQLTPALNQLLPAFEQATAAMDQAAEKQKEIQGEVFSEFLYDLVEYNYFALQKARQDQIKAFEDIHKKYVGLSKEILGVRDEFLNDVFGKNRGSEQVTLGNLQEATARLRAGDETALPLVQALTKQYQEQIQATSKDFVELAKNAANLSGVLGNSATDLVGQADRAASAALTIAGIRGTDAPFVQEYLQGQIDDRVAAGQKPNRAAFFAKRSNPMIKEQDFGPGLSDTIFTELKEFQEYESKVLRIIEARQKQRYLEKAERDAKQAQIPKFADGGFVSGLGTGRSDSIPAFLSNGEFVMQSSAVDRIGVPALNMMNRGVMPAANTEMIQELRALRAEVAQLRQDNSAENRSLVTATSKTAQVLVKVTDNGDSFFTEARA